MRNRLLTLLLLAGGLAFGQVSIGIQIGAPPPVRVERLAPSPGPDFVWIAGYWYPMGGHYRWHSGYWTRPPYPGARWVIAHHDGERFYDGYWDGERGRWDHDHHWDRDHDRDYGRYHDRDHDRDRDRDRDRDHDRR